MQGRLIDHLRNTASVALDELAFLVLDEADRLLDMGFADEVLLQPPFFRARNICLPLQTVCHCDTPRLLHLAA